MSQSIYNQDFKELINSWKKGLKLNIGLLVAMHVEIPALFHGKSGVHQFNDCRVNVVILGIGQKKARYATKEMCSGFHGFHPD